MTPLNSPFDDYPKRVFIGIDPGQSGGIAYVREDRYQVGAYKMPETDQDVLELLHDISEIGSCHAYLEQVHSMPGQGVASSFKFGEGYGKLQMALMAMKIPCTKVIPRKWQQKLGCLSGGDKNITKARAQQLFADWKGIKITHAIADALLIAEYGRQIHK